MTESPEKYPFLRGLLRSVVTVGGVIGICFGLAGLASRQTEAAEPTAPARVFALPEVVLSQPSAEARATAALAQNKPEDARRALKTELNRATEPSLGRLRYLLAKATPDIVEARPLLEALATSAHPLANWGRLRLTERLRETDPNAAAESASLLMTEPLFRARAEQLMALSLYAAGRPEEAEPLLRSLVAEAPEKSAAVSVAMPLAAILGAKADLESRKYAIAVYRRVITRAPLGDSAEQARIAVQQLLAQMPETQRTALSSLTADEAFAEAEALQSGRDYLRAAERFSAIAQRFKGDPKSVCDARLGQGKALFSANKRNEALTVLEDVARLCPSAEHRASAHFQAGRALLRRGDPRGAIAHYDAVAREFPSHRLADDALFAASTAFHDLKDTESERTRLQQLLRLKPAGDLRPDARFALGWLERSESRYQAALEQFDQQLAEGTGERSEDIIGRTEYWRARTLLNLKRTDDAEEAYRALFKSRPLSYYGQQALARLQDLDPPLATNLVAELRDPPAANNDRQPQLRLAKRPELENPEFQRAIELLRVAEPAFAVEELDSMRCFNSSSPDDLYLLCAALLSEFGADAQATTLARKRGTQVMTLPPKGQTIALWRVVYPRAFAGVLDDAAHKSEVPPAFVRAIAREESSFDPNAVSPADAYGLTQLIRPTARTYAGQLRLPSDLESLKTPEINLRIGAAFMHALFERYKQNVAVVPAAYNAGPGAADKWIRERGRISFDEWVELIPYNETRHYTRRVLQSYGAYAWLDEGRFPALPSELYKAPATVATRK